MRKSIPLSTEQVQNALQAWGGNRAVTARALGISVRTLARRLHSHPHLRHEPGLVPRPAWLEELWRLEHAVFRAALDKRWVIHGYLYVKALPTDPVKLLKLRHIERRFDEIADITRWRG